MGRWLQDAGLPSSLKLALSLFNTIFRKLVVVLLLFGLLMMVIFGIIMRYSHDIYHQEVQQKFHINMATRFATLAGWTPDGWTTPKGVSAAFASLETSNPQFHAFILDRDGLILSHYPENVRLVSDHVSLQPIKIILQENKNLPILGDDPLQANGKEIFSVAQLQGNYRTEQYLYITLHSEEHEESTRGLRLSYITRDSAWLIFASLTLALLGGLLSLHFVVRPLKRLASAMDEFREQNFTGDVRIYETAAPSGDEIDTLNATFQRMAEQMQAQMQQIEQADSSRREFITNVSHDLRTPLASIQGYLDTLALKNDTLSPQERQQYLQVALNQAKSLSQLINTLFYLSKLDSGQIALEPERFMIEEVAQDVVQKFALQAQRKNIKIIAEAHAKLPFVCADLGLIERALSNLIDNALRHTPDGGSVQLRFHLADEKVWVSVLDSGHGILATDLPHIFERFYRGNRVRGESAEHAGLGLSIVRRIIDMHGEVVEAINAPGNGALFRFSLRSSARSDTPCTQEIFSS